MHFFMRSAPGFFYESDGKFSLTQELEVFTNNPTFLMHFKDIIDYKTRRFYKERLENKQDEVYRMTKKEHENTIKFALRDEYVNIMAMTRGGVEAKYNYQILLCKKSPISNENGLFLLDAKKSASTYDLSATGKKYYSALTEKESDHIHEYAARIDSQLKIKINPELFNQLYKKGFFSIWTPEAPLKYFEKCETGYLVIFKVFKLKQPVSENLLEKGRKGRNFLFRLRDEVAVEIAKPVIRVEDFDNMKKNIISILEENNWLV